MGPVLELTKKNWGSDVEMFEILHRDWNLQPIFTQKRAFVDMNWGYFQPWMGPILPLIISVPINRKYLY